MFFQGSSYREFKKTCYVASYSMFNIINRFSDTADGPPPRTGVFAPNNELQKARRLFEGELAGAEAFAADEDGMYVYKIKSYIYLIIKSQGY